MQEAPCDQNSARREENMLGEEQRYSQRGQHTSEMSYHVNLATQLLT